MDEDIAKLKGVGEKIAKKLNILGIQTKHDLISYYPRKYDDFSEISKITDLEPGAVSIKAKIKQATGRYVRRGMHITEAVASDDTNSVRLVWFNQPYRAKALKAGSEYYISGSYELSRGRFAIMNPGAELVSNFPVNTARIIPIYRETKGVKSNQIRKVLASVKKDIGEVSEILPEFIIQEQKLLSRAQALLSIHFPKSAEDLAEAKRRLAFEEVFTLVLSALINKKDNLKSKAPKIPFDEKLIKSFVESLPYKLTDAQRKVAWQVFQDIEKNIPANRLIEGDVGSGKTIVATMVCLLAVKQGGQAAVMAPTEILARQHFQTFSELLKIVGLEKQIHLLLGSMKPSEKTKVQKAIESSDSGLIIGTHSLIAEKANFKNLSLAVIDEQHRFGVDQRKQLLKKAGHIPHLISMTATPIPRSLALTVYGELDISIIDELPPGRTRPITKIVSPNSKSQLYKQLDKSLGEGRQMFVVCPLISESDSLHYLSAEEVYKDFSERAFKHRRVALIHGKLKTEEKVKIMDDFTAGKINILVSTTVIEVGVNIPNASIMLIEGVERFGLAQIHQLRGRIGRGEHQGYCYLLMSDSNPPSRRVRALENTSDGFKLAELDLEIRGPGAIYGASQHGVLDLRLANISDTKLVAQARNAAQSFLEGNNLDDYLELAEEVYKNRTITSLN
ncbi:MAG TPA: ATP-dependent DNA helicase RecG [Candidatus Saccharimonadales bacterium]|nr:ATP-dependent DNA helicase RecG [Candidatus Saccharimonadales bacterium]